MTDRPCVIGPCRCGGFGIVHDEQAEAETGLCHQQFEEGPLSPEDEARRQRAEWLRRTMPDPFCCWCYVEALDGERDDAGRLLTDEEASEGFFTTHAECRPKLDAMFARLASRGVFVDVIPAE